MRTKVSIVFLVLWLASCASYYTKNISFHQKFESRKFAEANKILDKDKKAENRKTKLLFYLNKGTTLHLMGEYAQSNEYFEKAYLFIEDYRENYGLTAASFLVNPSVIYYQGEEHEKLFINYYKALNYLYLKKYDEALVEVRRMNLRLNQLNDKYSNKNKYQKDAFIHLLMGIVYDINNDVNNAFIAYRNAYDIYVSDYQKQFGMAVPDQLKKDLLRTTTLLGMYNEKDRYERIFGMKYKPEKHDANVYFIWNNGLGPHKEEWSITFTVIQGGGGNVTFSNAEYGFSFTYPRSSYSSSGADFGDIQVIRIVLPKYMERKQMFTAGDIVVDTSNTRHKLDLAEDINAIAFKVLQDRLLKELAQELIRVAIKQALAEAARKENENLGTALSILNAFTQKADTRNWATIPHSIYYTRIGLDEGDHELTLNQYVNADQKVVSEIPVTIKKNNHQILSFSSLNYHY